MRCWCKGTPEEFWVAFSDENGIQLKYTAILDHLAKECTTRNEELARKAQAEYGDRFTEFFSYTKAGQRHVKVRACDIAKTHHEIKNLEEDEDEG